MGNPSSADFMAANTHASDLRCPGDQAVHEPAWLHFRVQELHRDRNEGIAVADFNGDGKPDVSAGEFWYENPGPQALREGRLWRRHVLVDTGLKHNEATMMVDLDGDGRPELITGKRYYGHGGRDPGADDGVVIHAYKWQSEKNSFQRHPIVVSEPGKLGPGVGLQLRVADLNGNGRPDLAATGKSGTYIIWNEGMQGTRGRR